MTTERRNQSFFRMLQPRQRFEQMTRPERPTLASTFRRRESQRLRAWRWQLRACGDGTSEENSAVEEAADRTVVLRANRRTTLRFIPVALLMFGNGSFR